MRKIQPSFVKKDFDSGIEDLRAFYLAADEGISGDKNKSFLAESTVLSGAVLWKGFLSDLFVAYINRDSSQFVVHLRNSFEGNLAGKQKRIYDKYVTLGLPSHVTKKDIGELTDASGSNITFRDYEEIVEGAKRWLAVKERGKIVGVSGPRKGLVNALVSIRNQLAHRSVGSRDRMNSALGHGSLTPIKLKRGINKVSNVGAWLKSKPAGANDNRLNIFLVELQALANSL